MTKYFSINDAIEEQCQDEIIDILDDYLQKHPEEFGEYSYLVDKPDEAELISSEIKFIGVSKLNKKEFDIKIQVEAIAFTSMRIPSGEVESDEIYPNFLINYVGCLKDRIYEFIFNDLELEGEYEFDKNIAMSPYMIPYLYADKMDDLAEAFLNEYYPEALIEPTPIDTTLITDRMGLKVISANLTQSESIFGQIFFDDGVATCFNPHSGEYEKKDIESGTIIYDPNVFFMRSIGSVNNTIIHECVHWYLHKPFIYLQNMYTGVKDIKCLVDEDRKSLKEKNQYEWVEWHSNHLAPRILMPAKMAKVKIEELYKFFESEYGTTERLKVVQAVIYELARFFKVSKLSAKIRMLDLGYQEAEGVLNYVDNRYIENFNSNNHNLNRGESYIINDAAALKLYESNINIRNLIDQRKIVYVENRFCLNSPEYIQISNDHVRLTNYAKSHPEECCIAIAQRREINPRYGMKYYNKSILFSSAIVNEMVFADSNLESEHNQQVLKKMKDTSDTYDEIVEILTALPGSFHETLVYHMKRKNCTVLDLVSEAHVFKQKITDMRNNPNPRWSLEDVLSVCIGLHLHPEFIFDMLTKAMINISYNSKDNIFYRGMIHQHYSDSIEVWNEKLKERGYPLLGTKNK